MKIKDDNIRSEKRPDINDKVSEMIAPYCVCSLWVPSWLIEVNKSNLHLCWPSQTDVKFTLLGQFY